MRMCGGNLSIGVWNQKQTTLPVCSVWWPSDQSIVIIVTASRSITDHTHRCPSFCVTLAQFFLQHWFFLFAIRGHQLVGKKVSFAYDFNFLHNYFRQWTLKILETFTGGSAVFVYGAIRHSWVSGLQVFLWRRNWLFLALFGYFAVTR